MSKTTPAGKISRALGAGVVELPANAAWLLSKALKPARHGGESAAQTASSVADEVVGTATTAAGATGAAASGARRKARHVRDVVAGAIPGLDTDSVRSLMADADDAADRAGQQEARALAVAEEARDRAREAVQTARDADQEVHEIRRNADRRVAARVAAAEREKDDRLRKMAAEADRRTEQERAAGNAEARQAIEQAEVKASERVRVAQGHAEQAQQRAQAAIDAADQALAVARDLASQAAQAAAAVAGQASQEADRLEGQARDAAEAKRRADQADRVRQEAENRIPSGRLAVGQRRSGRTPGSREAGPRGSGRASGTRAGRQRGSGRASSNQAAGRRRSGRAAARQAGSRAGRGTGEPGRMTETAFLRSLTRSELQRLAGDLPSAGAPDTTKEQLVTAIVRAGGAPLDDLTNAELMRLGRRRGERVNAKMNKSQLMAALTAGPAS